MEDWEGKLEGFAYILSPEECAEDKQWYVNEKKKLSSLAEGLEEKR